MNMHQPPVAAPAAPPRKSDIPDDMELLADGKTLLVASRWARKLTWVDVPNRKVIHQVKVGKSPHGVFTLSHAPRQ